LSRIVGKYLAPLFVEEAPTGAINGSNVTFTLSQAASDPNAVQLTLDGVVLTPITHYSISGTTITMADAPASGQNLRARYIRAA